MRVLVLGGAGFVGRRVVAQLQQAGGFEVSAASRHPRATPGVRTLSLDARDSGALGTVLREHDALVNCVTGSGPDILANAASLLQALPGSGCRRLVHMSSMAAFGDVDGDVDDETPLGSGGGWYAQAKRDAELQISTLVGPEMGVALLRPGCVHGPGSHLWVERVGDWLRQRRLGDLGAIGDGWSNLVHVDDVARATVRALQVALPADAPLRVNLAAPDSPRWNDYFTALAVALGSTPVRRIHPRQLQLDAYLAAVPLRLWERVAPRLHVSAALVPPALPPSLLKLFAQHRRLRSTQATSGLGLRWTSFAEGVADSARWYRSSRHLAP
ncbi:MAG: NAD-dependent epimerase/dehydratase family protein [Burkholderiaceae bacterium]|nr:NAD-dependent epimerase/dehydratase family protein [Burkholderiaceae bacterium]